MAVIRYLVEEIDSSVEFYTNVLGLELKQRWGPAFAIVASGDLDLWLSGPVSSAARPMPDGRRPEAGCLNLLVVEVEDIELSSHR